MSGEARRGYQKPCHWLNCWSFIEMRPVTRRALRFNDQ